MAFLTRLPVLLLVILTSSPAMAQEKPAPEPRLYVVNFTADWCPNCKILDPALAEALSSLGIPMDGDSKEKKAPIPIRHIELDLTNPARSLEAFEKVNGFRLGRGLWGLYRTHRTGCVCRRRQW